MNAPEEKTWNIPNRLEILPGISRDVHDWLETHNLSSRAKYVGRLAVEEVVGNTVKYGYADGGEHTITLRIAIERDFLRMEFEDDGREFDPTARPAADLEDVLENIPDGGLGLTLLGRVCAKMAYERKGILNHLTLWIRKLEPDDTQYIALDEPLPEP